MVEAILDLVLKSKDNIKEVNWVNKRSTNHYRIYSLDVELKNGDNFSLTYMQERTGNVALRTY